MMPIVTKCFPDTGDEYLVFAGCSIMPENRGRSYFIRSTDISVPLAENNNGTGRMYDTIDCFKDFTVKGNLLHEPDKENERTIFRTRMLGLICESDKKCQQQNQADLAIQAANILASFEEQTRRK
jgi:hypothetical protein